MMQSHSPSLEAPSAPPETRETSLGVQERPSLETTIAVLADEAVPASPPTKPKPAPRAKVLFLDGMRGAAAMLVVCEHLSYFSGRTLGGVAVHTFFVLSAFLLTMLLEKKLATLLKLRACPQRWGLALADYTIRRVLRVYPLVLVMGIMLAFSSDAHKYQWYDFKYNLYHYNFFKLLVFAEGHHFYVFWTLPLELTYYLLIPIFVVVALCLRRWWWVPMLPLTGWVIYSGLYVYVTAGSSFSRHLREFVAGSIGAVVYNRLSDWIQKSNFSFRRWHRILIWIIEAVVILHFISVVFDALIFDDKWYGPYPFKIKGSDHFVCMNVVVLIVLEMVCPGPVSSFFEWSLLRYAGKVSFSIYLLHPRIIFSDFIKSQKNYYTKFFAVWILVFFWSTVSYHLVEHPSQKLAGYVGKKLKVLDAKQEEKDKEKNHYRALAL